MVEAVRGAMLAQAEAAGKNYNAPMCLTNTTG